MIFYTLTWWTNFCRAVHKIRFIYKFFLYNIRGKAFPLASARSRATSAKENFVTCDPLSCLRHTPFA